MKPFLIPLAISIFLTLLMPVKSFCQAVSDPTGNPIIDAPLLQTYLNNFKNGDAAAKAIAIKNIYTLFNKYSTGIIKDINDLKVFIDGNNYLKNIPNLMNGASLTMADMSTMVQSNTIEPAQSQALNLSASTVGGAIGTFIATRFKQEVETAFIDKLKTWIDSSKYKVMIAALLPETKAVLKNNDPYQYTTFLQSLREAFTKDLNNLPTDLEKYLEDPSKDPILKGIASKTEYYPAVFLYKTILQIKNLSSLINEINSWSQSADPLFAKLGDIKNYLQLISVFSYTITDPASVNGEVSDIKYLSLSKIAVALNPANNDNLKYFTGLFLLKNNDLLKSISFGSAPNNKNLYDLINTNSAAVGDLTTWLKNESIALSNTATALTKVKKELIAGHAAAEDISACIDALMSAVKGSFAFPFVKFNVIIDPKIINVGDAVLSDVKSLSEIVIDFQNKNYGLVFNHFMDLLKANGLKDQDLITLIEKYGNFVVSVVSATSQQEVINALETAALPVGSYRIKRNAYINIALNAYAGGFFGYQQYFSSKIPAGVNSTNTLLGFTAPVGVSFSWGWTCDKRLAKSSGTIFISLIDVGAVTAFRLQNDATTNLPNFTWSNILAPGGYFIYGVKNNPLSFGIGAQYGPQLRSLTAASITTAPAAWTYRAFVAIDIPFFDFYTKAQNSMKSTE